MYDGLAGLPHFNPDDDFDRCPCVAADRSRLRRRPDRRVGVREDHGRPGRGGPDGLVAAPDVRERIEDALRAFAAALR
jgi:hypothetical protein